MKIFETSKFKRLRKKLKSDSEKAALRHAVELIFEAPSTGKKLKGEFKDLRSLRYFADGQERRIIYKLEHDVLILLSFGPREGIYR